MSEEIEPCPFCGSDSLAAERRRCPVPALNGPTPLVVEWVVVHLERGRCRVVLPTARTASAAIANWNRVARDAREAPELREKVERLTEALTRAQDEIRRLEARR